MGETGEVELRSNRDTIDDPNRQKLTMSEIEELKKEGTGAGKDLIARLMLSHSGIAEKTAFSLAKYTLRKSRKFMRRFTVLPLDVPTLAQWLLNEKEPMKIMEMREETLSLIGSWANVHWNNVEDNCPKSEASFPVGTGRWLMVDETGGLVVAAMAEKMGILYPDRNEDNPDSVRVLTENNPEVGNETSRNDASKASDSQSRVRPRQRRHQHIPAMSARSNTITVLHTNAQPNLSLLRYFSFDTNNPSTSHPLYTHLKSLSWLQLLSPEDDPSYAEPELVPDEVLSKWKSSKRGTYFWKRRRWERVHGVVKDTQAGQFDGLVIASTMSPVTILHYAVPLLRGGAPVVVYSPYIEPLAELADYYSTARRTAYISDPPDPASLPNADFPINPTLLLAPTIQTARAQYWQCLPGRTHPLMTGRGGPEGYLFTATRVLPAEGKVEARGRFKRRKIQKSDAAEHANGEAGRPEPAIAPVHEG